MEQLQLLADGTLIIPYGIIELESKHLKSINKELVKAVVIPESVRVIQFLTFCSCKRIRCGKHRYNRLMSPLPKNWNSFHE